MINVKAFHTITYGIYVVSSFDKSGKGSGFIANSVFQVTSDPPQIAIACNKNNYTAQIISESKVLSVSVLEKETDLSLIGNFGYKSGKDFDKFENFSYKKGELDVPILLDNTIAYFEAKVVDTFDVGSHYIFIGEIVGSDLILKDREALTYSYYRDSKKGKSPKNAPSYIKPQTEDEKSTKKMDDKPRIEKSIKKYECLVCGWVYDPNIGDPDSGIKPGTSFEDIPEDWVCPICGASKSDFEELSD